MSQEQKVNISPSNFVNKSSFNFDKTRLYLSIKLELESSKINDNDADKFFVETKVAISISPTAYHYENLEKTFENTRSYTKADIEENISKLIEECYEILEQNDKDCSNLGIEWILPDDLFLLDVDCWEWKEDEDYSKLKRIGCSSFASVHIRSSRRLKVKRFQKKWENKWNIIMNNSQNINVSQYLLASQVNNKTDNDLKIEDNKKNIIGINFPANLRKLENLSYDLIIETGIPLALWSRCQNCAVNHLSDLDMLINPNNDNFLNLENLLTSIENKRLEAPDSNPLHLGHHLCFLWENPYNYPITDKFKLN